MKKKMNPRKNPGKKISGTEEWAKINLNIMKGCPHDCKYCFAKSMGVHYTRHKPEDWHNEVLNSRTYLARVRAEPGRIMFPSTHDITPDNIEYIVIKLRQILEAGNNVLLVSKPHYQCIKIICDNFSEYKDKITFRFTIGSLDSEILKFWEPFAPSFEERFSALQYAFNNGYKTSISCEPILDSNSVKLAEKLLPFVNDSIWFGKANRLKSILSLNGHKDKITLDKADELLGLYTKEYLFALYAHFKDNPAIKWKESIKDIIGIPRANSAGLDI